MERQNVQGPAGKVLQVMREFICSEPLEGASYGHTELYFINGSFVLVSERWGSVDDAASWEESETVTKDYAIDWVRRKIRNENQLKEVLRRINELAE